MSDYDRGKFYGKKKFPTQRVRVCDSQRTDVILTEQQFQDSSGFGSRCFNSKTGYAKSDSKESLTSDIKPKIKQPTILLKNRDHHEERPTSPKHSQKISDVPITIGVSATESHSHTQPASNEMKKSVKFLDDGVIYSENVQDFLQENNEFLVVGVVGSQGVGKSTILNLLAHNKITEKLKTSVFTDVKPKNSYDEVDDVSVINDGFGWLKVAENDVNKDAEVPVFKTLRPGTVEVDCNTTYGIDLFITNNRVILLDCQPFNSMSVLNELIQSENKRSNLVSEFLPLENSGEIYGLQLTAFLMSVCHVLILVQDWFFDSNVVRFIQSAEMLKPTISSIDEEIVDHFPHLVLLHNRAQMEDFSPSRFRTIQRVYRSVFNKTKLHLESGLGLGSGRIVNCISPANCGDPLNVFLIPEYKENDENKYKGHPPLEDLIRHLRANILGATKNPLTHVQLNEKNWLLYCSKVWDHVRKSSFFVEYTKLMP